MITFGSLFSGIGGIDLGLERAGMSCAWQVEIDAYAQKVLAKHWPNVARYGDIRECGKHNLAPVDLIAGGFPCQDISDAGKRVGIEGSRSGLWSEFYRVICELRPRFVLVENVSALLHRGIERVLGDLAACGYDAEWQVLSAEAVGALHIRERVFIVAYPLFAGSPSIGREIYTWEKNATSPSNTTSSSGAKMADTSSERGRLWQRSNGQERSQTDGRGSEMADPDRQGLAVGSCFGSYARQELTAFKRDCSTGAGQWATEPQLDRVVNGVPHRVDRLRGLGNAVVPQVAEYVGRCILSAIESAGVA